MRRYTSNRYRYGKHLYSSWVQMRSRCRNPNHTAYARYGGRGIRVCDEWNDYESFAKWALANGFMDGLTIERIDVNGNYCPENCAWITRGEQARNRRNNVKIEYNGQIKTAAEWSYEIGLNKNGLIRRLNRGLSLEEAMSMEKAHERYCGMKIAQLLDDNEIAVWSSARAAAKSCGGYHGKIILACKTGKTAYGYKWKFTDEVDA